MPEENHQISERHVSAIQTHLGIFPDKLATLLNQGSRFLLLDSLLYKACLRASLDDPRNPAVRGSVINPNVRGVLQHFRSIYEEIRESLDVIGLSKSLVDDYVQLRFREWRVHDIDTEGNKCSFYVGCPTNSLDERERQFAIETGVCIIHRDHILPSSHGGLDTQPMCAYHNRIKQDNWLFEPDLLKE